MTDSDSRTVDRCRACGSGRLRRYLDLGRTPLANSYRSADGAAEAEFSEELCLQLCPDCGLSQLTKVVAPDRMFRDYLYVSATTETMRAHFADFARAAARAAGAEPGALALDVASNDGTLLAAFRALGLEVLGVDPARNLAAEANARGLRTWPEYWSSALAERVAREAGRPRVITAANVLAHADDWDDFARAAAACLAPRGVLAFEFPHVVDFVERNEFDTAYHEHLSYVGLAPLRTLLGRHGLALFDADYFPDIHGGTVRAFAAREGERAATPRLDALLAREAAFGIKDPKVYEAFAARVLENRARLRAIVDRLRAEGRTLWAYGAGAKGNTLLNFFGLRADDVARIVDDNPKKWGLRTPGAGIEIAGPDALRGAKADVLLLLAWNFEKEIRRRCAAAGYRGRYLIPVPEARLAPAD
jgi:novobiocin biosynthesis protein NovU/D-mycarose 3-C-methyltransferase